MEHSTYFTLSFIADMHTFTYTHTHTQKMQPIKLNVERICMLASWRVTYLQNAGNTSVQGVAVEITVRMATLAVVLTLFTVCATCSSENSTLPSPVPAPTLATSTCDETMEVSDVMTVYRSDLWPSCD